MESSTKSPPLGQVDKQDYAVFSKCSNYNHRNF